MGAQLTRRARNNPHGRRLTVHTTGVAGHSPIHTDPHRVESEDEPL
jgi:hypothetical protein